jgi:hypothetical protein
MCVWQMCGGLQMRGECWYPAVVLKNAEMKFNFGHNPNAPLKFPLRMGYAPCASAAWADTSFAKTVVRFGFVSVVLRCVGWSVLM